MAPALIEEVVVEQTAVGYKSGVGQYKEAAFGGPKVFQKELELRGTDKHAPAKYPHYLPTWDNEKGGK
jgi:sulfonate dioxygenase